MKRISLLIALFFVAMHSDVIAAACGGGTRLPAAAIQGQFQDKLICAVSANNSDRWAEEHISNGQLFEHAKGSSDAIDPRRLAGSWTTSTDATGGIVTYNYTGNPPGNPYTWSVWTSDTILGGIKFCSADGTNLIATAKVLANPAATATNPCGFTIP